MCDVQINLKGCPAKKQPLVTELIPDQPSLSKRAQEMFVQIKGLTPNHDQLTLRAMTQFFAKLCLREV